MGALLHFAVFFPRCRRRCPMFEVNPVRNQIADLSGRLSLLRGFL